MTNKQILNTIICSLCLFIFCTRQSSRSYFELVQEYSVPIKISNLKPINTWHNENDSAEMVYIFSQDLVSSNLYIFELTSDTLSLFSTLEHIGSKGQTNSFLFQDLNSIYSYSNYFSKLKLQDSIGNLIHEFQIDQNYTPIFLLDSYTKKNQTKLVFNHADKNLGFGTKKERAVYYPKVKPLYLASVDTIMLEQYSFGKFPDSYISSSNSYYDHYATACFGRNGNICISFGADNHLYIYEDSLIKLKKEVSSKYISTFNKYPDEKQFDMLYLKNYITTEPKYLNIIYDTYQNVYYRVVKHRWDGQFEQEKQSWSIIVMDQNLNIIGEELFYMDEYDYRVLIPTPFGIILKQTQIHEKDGTFFKLYKIKWDF